jgi:hypothetical protein
MDRKGFEVMLNILAIGIKPPMNKLKSLKINSLVPSASYNLMSEKLDKGLGAVNRISDC